MRNTAYKLTAFTAILSAAGFLLRWLQNMQIYEEETGLARRGMPISFVVAGVILAAAAAFWFISLRLRRYDAPKEPENALGGRTFALTAVWAGAALILAASGALQLLGANTENYAESELVFRRIVGAASLASSALLALLMTGLTNAGREGLRRWCSGLLILFTALWLSAAYKSAASDPVLWRSAVEILAICATMMAFYHMAGYFFGQPKPTTAVFFCNLGAFLSVMSAIDENPVGESLCFAAVAVIQLIWSYSIIVNLSPKEPPSEGITE